MHDTARVGLVSMNDSSISISNLCRRSNVLLVCVFCEPIVLRLHMLYVAFLSLLLKLRPQATFLHRKDTLKLCTFTRSYKRPLRRPRL